ncbi:hypothetical protein ILYODFUR_030262 [Ilyodon furcidens]|uniref:Uncharacterized protein n=1 Tax=Ilyodon furcidens TaxID=33524 RepID=A0ABV0TG70_9TELE
MKKIHRESLQRISPIIPRNEEAEHRKPGTEHERGNWFLHGKNSKGSLLLFMLILSWLDDLQLRGPTGQSHPAVTEGKERHTFTHCTQLCGYDIACILVHVS